jgi:hypothetical protein
MRGLTLSESVVVIGCMNVGGVVWVAHATKPRANISEGKTSAAKSQEPRLEPRAKTKTIMESQEPVDER